MKNIFLVLLLFLSINAYSQPCVTKFLGIPIDGYKSDMIQQLEQKGFEYDPIDDCLRGEFNGYDVLLFVVTDNNKVYRIMVADQNWTNEVGIRIRFNKLCSQFEKNAKYRKPLFAEDYKLPEDTDISYDISVKHKRFEASYYQIGSEEDLAFDSKMCTELHNSSNDKDTTSKSFYNYLMCMEEVVSTRSVWFFIDDKYGKYRILMYYDNELNHSDGEDL
ncbi:MAG: hypothetical protein PUC50_08230 [Bacteroidales bacterium]|nr:hypothetical protein [Bacteroidales bacterium]